MAETELEERNMILDDHNVTLDTFCQYPVMANEQGVGTNSILTIEKLKSSDALAETLKGLIINDAGYYSSDKNDAEGDPKIDPKVATQSTDRLKRKVIDTNTTNIND